MNRNYLIITLLVVTLIGGIVHAQDSLNVTKVGEIAYWDEAWDVELNGNYAYVADGYAGLRVVNISNPHMPTESSYFVTGENIIGVAIYQDYAYIATGSYIIKILNISNPSHPVEVGSYTGPGTGSFQGISVLGNYAYLAGGIPGLIILDISNPSEPLQVGISDTPGFAHDVYVQGSYAYIADGYNGGLTILDVAIPSNPQVVGHLDIPGNAVHLKVSGNYAYLSILNSGIRIINITNPTSPNEVSSCSVQGAEDLAIFGDFAYVASGSAGLKIVSIANPLAPNIIGTFNTTGYAYSVAISGTNAMVADYDAGLRIINVTTPNDPVEIGFYSRPGYVWDIATLGNYAYAAAGILGTRVIDVSDPTAPFETDYQDTLGDTYRCVVSGNYLYMSSSYPSDRIADLSDPATPIEVGHFGNGDGWGLDIEGNYAYAGFETGLHIFDISDPTSPYEVGNCALPGEVLDVAVAGAHAYVANQNWGLRIVNISNLESPFLNGYYWLPEHSHGVAAIGETAYIANGTYGLRIFDVSISRAPTLIGQYDSPGLAVGLVVSGSYAFIADHYDGIRIVDISNPAFPEEVGYYKTPGTAQRIILSGNLLYVSDGYFFGIYQFTPPGGTLDLTTTPVNPPVIIPTNGGSFQYNCNVHNLTTQPQSFSLWNKVRSGTTYYPVFGPATRTLPGGASPSRVMTQWIAGSIPSGTLTFISYVGTYPSTIQDSSYFNITKQAGVDGGPWIGESYVTGDVFDEYAVADVGATHASPLQPGSFTLLGASPNPFNPTTTFHFTLPEAAQVTLEVFDINGRIVGAHGMRPSGGGGSQGARSAPLQAGSHEIVFDGSGLPSGVYLYRLTASGSGATPTIVSGKMVLLK